MVTRSTGWARAFDLVGQTTPYPMRRAVSDWIEPRLAGRLTRARIALRAAGARDEADRFQTWFAPFTAMERENLLSNTLSRPGSIPIVGNDAIDRMLRHDLVSWLPDNLLERGDRMSMASSLELRPPLLDHHLVELALALPSKFRIRNGTTKWS